MIDGMRKVKKAPRKEKLEVMTHSKDRINIRDENALLWKKSILIIIVILIILHLTYSNNY